MKNSNTQVGFVDNAVMMVDGKAVTSSFVVADIFNKRHQDVLRSIRKLDCSAEFTERNFTLCLTSRELANKVVRKDPSYQITRDGFVFLAMGYTGKTAARFKEQYINAFNHLEEQVQKKSISFVSELYLSTNLKVLGEIKRTLYEVETGLRSIQKEALIEEKPKLYIPSLSDVDPNYNRQLPASSVKQTIAIEQNIPHPSKSPVTKIDYKGFRNALAKMKVGDSMLQPIEHRWTLSGAIHTAYHAGKTRKYSTSKIGQPEGMFRIWREK